MRFGRVGRATLFGALILAASPFGQLATAHADYNPDFYDWCMNNLSEGSDYCCEHAGGVVRSGGCVDPATLNTQGGQQSTPTKTFRPVPSQILAPPATAVNPGMR
jgi:hypothetical protein